ncbi:GNAT family N-acetyltransferase [Henriciella sp.]|uniref:GNAT family N-acetyltransferase n=1 Tax=Henriciella sp. TaxID=1968823 RepID=UPI003516283F
MAAGQLFAPTGLLNDEALKDHVPRHIMQEAIRSHRLDVARVPDGRAVGFTLVSLKPTALYLDQISVHPEYGRSGIGRSLMRQLVTKARELGQTRIVLSTFRDVEWNGPFYASLGYKPVQRTDYEPFMIDIEKAQAPFMDVSKRIFMRKRIRKPFIRAKKPV